jgi:hypothetical protein
MQDFSELSSFMILKHFLKEFIVELQFLSPFLALWTLRWSEYDALNNKYTQNFSR